MVSGIASLDCLRGGINERGAAFNFVVLSLVSEALLYLALWAGIAFAKRSISAIKPTSAWDFIPALRIVLLIWRVGRKRHDPARS